MSVICECCERIEKNEVNTCTNCGAPTIVSPIKQSFIPKYLPLPIDIPITLKEIVFQVGTIFIVAGIWIWILSLN